MLHVDVCVYVCVKPGVMGTVVEVLVMMHSWVSRQEYVALTDMCGFNTHHKLPQPHSRAAIPLFYRLFVCRCFPACPSLPRARVNLKYT